MPIAAKSPAEKRAHRRIATKLLGRYMLADRREFPCTIVDVAEGGVALTGPERGQIGEPVIIYIDQLGRVEGKIVRHIDDGFAVRLTVNNRAAEKLAARIMELEASDAPPRAPDRRREPRITPDEPKVQTDTVDAEAQIVNLSLFGAEINMKERPPVGALVQVGRLKGRVVRQTKSGVAIEFLDKNEAATLTERLTEIALPKVR